MKKVIRNIMLFIFSAGIRIMWIIPIRKNQILFSSFRGQFSDSPKYIFKDLQNRGMPYRYIWVSKKEGQGIPEECIRVKGQGIRYFYYLSTSKVIITNDYINTYYPRRKGQKIINTWHGGSPLKTVGMVGAEVSSEELDFFHRHDKIYSCYLSSSEFMTQEVFRKSFGYTGKIYSTGMPRNAILLREHEDLCEKVRHYFGIGKDKGIALYAPTFRGSATQGGFLPKEEQFDICKCLDALKRKFGKEFCMLFRAHHACSVSLESGNMILASDYPDMQELLCASDVLITDYSSCMGDHALMYKPVFLFCPDLEEYIQERGFYWDIFLLPFPVAKNEADFIRQIDLFDPDSYQTGVNEYLARLGTYENPEADRKVGDMVIKWMNGEDNEK